MFMEPRKKEVYDHINGFTPYDDDILPIFDHNSSVGNGYRFKDESLDFSFLDLPNPVHDPEPNLDPGSLSVSPSMPAQEDSPDEFNDYVFDFIDQILVEENVEGMQSLFYDPLELQATERSLYEALGEEYPYSQPQVTLSANVENSEDNVVGSSGDFGTNSSTSYGNYPHPDWSGGYNLDSNSSVAQAQSLDPAPFWSYDSNTSVTNAEMLNTHVAQNIFTDSESIKQFNRGMEEASRFLPSSKPLVIDLDQYDLPQDSKDDSPKVVVKVEKVEKVEKDRPSNGLKGRKHYQSDDNVFEEERRNKQSAVYVEEDELSEFFDRVLLGADANGNLISCHRELPIIVNHKSQQNGSTGGSTNGRAAKKQTTKAIDLSTLLVNCAQAVATGDRRSAYEQLNQMRQHASTSGDASQRLAHVFVTGIEARLAGTGSQLYAAKCASRISAVDKLLAYQVFLSACPFKKIAMTFANKTIFDSASTSSTIHIVDFGIAYGFQWPFFIKHLSNRPNGPPKLRITGIEYPQPGFRPAERLEETGRRLASYCKRFNVPFEYNAIASQNWETIKVEDLKLQRNDLAVNCLARFQNLLDETVCVESPRDQVLKLIRDMKPDIFVHEVINGAYSSPYFVTRFKETLFYYSALFDMFDATIERENEQRLNFEKQFFGRGAMNVIACDCEGAERVERPESYNQWQVRVSRAGFKLKPLNQDLVEKLRCKRDGYHKDFVFDEDSKWILQGWKGRILYASSCWVPV